MSWTIDHPTAETCSAQSTTYYFTWFIDHPHCDDLLWATHVTHHFTQSSHSMITLLPKTCSGQLRPISYSDWFSISTLLQSLASGNWIKYCGTWDSSFSPQLFSNTNLDLIHSLGNWLKNAVDVDGGHRQYNVEGHIKIETIIPAW